MRETSLHSHTERTFTRMPREVGLCYLKESKQEEGCYWLDPLTVFQSKPCRNLRQAFISADVIGQARSQDFVQEGGLVWRGHKIPPTKNRKLRIWPTIFWGPGNFIFIFCFYYKILFHFPLRGPWPPSPWLSPCYRGKAQARWLKNYFLRLLWRQLSLLVSLVDWIPLKCIPKKITYNFVKDVTRYFLSCWVSELFKRNKTIPFFWTEWFTR